MDNISNVSSEEDLQQMLEDGRINQQEYEQLRTALQSPAKKQVESPPADADKATSKRLLGKIAFGLMLAGLFILGFYVFGAAAKISFSRIAAAPLLFLEIATLISAIVVGIIAWPDIFAKAAVITSAILLVLTALCIA